MFNTSDDNLLKPVHCLLLLYSFVTHYRVFLKKHLKSGNPNWGTNSNSIQNVLQGPIIIQSNSVQYFPHLRFLISDKFSILVLHCKNYNTHNTVIISVTNWLHKVRPPHRQGHSHAIASSESFRKKTDALFSYLVRNLCK